MEKLGVLAALTTACFWSLAAIFFENVTHRAGPLAVNFWKVTFALFFLTISAAFGRGLPFPTDASLHAWVYLSISGLLGFVIADYFLLNAYLLIGSRTTVVFQAITPLFTAFFALIFLGERMNPLSLLGMAVVIAGILIVVLSHRKGREAANSNSPSTLKGYLFAFLSTLFQAFSMIFSKAGLGDYSAISGTQIRIITAILGFGLQALILRQGKQVFVKPLKEGKVLKFLLLGSIVGPFLGVTCSLFALQNTAAGTASTLIALTPVFIIPPSIIILKQKVKPVEIAGAAIAVCGVALFFLL
ncbi:MAG: DMT family transporter [Spirochaetes bacterium]|nr:DMT family transporter [Spirochaetota bacterium]